MNEQQVINEEIVDFHFQKDDALLSEAERQAIEKERQVILDTPFIYELLKDLAVTDLQYDGTKLTKEDIYKGVLKCEYQPTPQEINIFLNKVQNVKKEVFNTTNPSMNTMLGYLRINAVHAKNSTAHHTFSIRVARPNLVTKSMGSFIDSDDPLIKQKVEKLLDVLIKAKSGTVIVGDTGVGKTEVQKTIPTSFAKDAQIVLIEDTPDSHIKRLYPDLIIKSWVLDDSFPAELAVSDAMRNNPDYAIIAEVRNKIAGNALDIAKSGHGLFMTAHASGSKDAPYRLIPLIRSNESYAHVSDELLGKEIARYFPLSLYMVKERPNENNNLSQTKRYIKEITLTTDYEKGHFDSQFIYKHSYEYVPSINDYVVKEQLNKLPESILQKIQDKRLIHLLPVEFGGRYVVETNTIKE